MINEIKQCAEIVSGCELGINEKIAVSENGQLYVFGHRKRTAAVADLRLFKDCGGARIGQTELVVAADLLNLPSDAGREGGSLNNSGGAHPLRTDATRTLSHYNQSY